MSKNPYADAKKYLQGNKIKLARQSFIEAIRYNKNKKKAILNLIMLDLKEGNYSKARSMINENQKFFSNEFRFHKLRSFLEYDEYNFKKATSLASQNFDETNYNEITRLLAEIFMQGDDLSKSYNLYYSLLAQDDYLNDALLGLVTLKIIEKDYPSALEILNEIDYNKLHYSQKKDYMDLKIYLSYFLGILKKEDTFIQKRHYKFSRLFNNNPIELLDHLEKHLHPRPDYDDGFFNENIVLPELITEIEDILPSIRPIHFLSGDKYRIKLNHKIGYIAGTEVEDICVVTFINTDIILTMYPIKLSPKFDSEHKNHILLPK